MSKKSTTSHNISLDTHPHSRYITHVTGSILKAVHAGYEMKPATRKPRRASSFSYGASNSSIDWQI